jgi:hypothetical protein
MAALYENAEKTRLIGGRGGDYLIGPGTFNGKFNQVNMTAVDVGGRSAGVCASKHRGRLLCILFMNALTWGCLIVLILSFIDAFGPSETTKKDCSYGDDYCYPQTETNTTPMMMKIFSGVGLGISVLLNWFMMCMRDPILAHLNNSVDGVTDLQTYVAVLHNAAPRIVMSIVCYHYETRYRTVTVTNSDGTTSTRTESYQEQVVTHSASADFRYAVCVDVSPALTVPMLERTIRLGITSRHTFADPGTAAQFENEYRSFVASNTRDAHQTHGCHCDVPGLKPSQLVSVHAGSGRTADEKSCALQPTWYWLAGLLSLNGLYGVFFANAASEMDYEIVKSVSRCG